jgi:hypothetical protein
LRAGCDWVLADAPFPPPAKKLTIFCQNVCSFCVAFDAP